MLTRSRITLAALASMLAAGNAFAASKEAQEFMSIQSRMAPVPGAVARLRSSVAADHRSESEVQVLISHESQEIDIAKSRVAYAAALTSRVI
jgi:hypothetical protein